MDIDIESIVKSRMGRKARWVPGFVFSLLKKLIHQDFINGYLRQGRVGVDFCQGALDYLGIKVEVEGSENLPADDATYHTFVSNHPLGAIDGMALGALLGKRYDGRIKYLVNDFLMNLSGLAPLCVPVNKIGAQARSLPQMVEAIYKGENHVIIFPAGLCSRRIGGKIQDLPWRKSFIAKSRQHHRDIVPIHFIGRNSSCFYTVANLCKWLHLPNFAMALLPDEMYRSRGKHYTVRIGKPIPWQTFDHEHSTMEWAENVRQKVYEL